MSYRCNRKPDTKIIILSSLKDTLMSGIKTCRKQIIVTTFHKLMKGLLSRKNHIIMDTNLKLARLLNCTNNHLSSMPRTVNRSTTEAVGTERPNPPNLMGSENSCCSSEVISHPNNAGRNKVLKMSVR